MSNPLISIIIPSYNSAKYIFKTIKSALSQTYSNIELVIVDDGSTDNSFAIAKSFADERVFTYSQTNQGSTAARNKGILESTGKYVLFLDADDLIHPKTIEYCVNKIGRNDAIFFNAFAIDKNDDILFARSFKPIFKNFYAINWMENAPWCGCVMLKKNKIINKWNRNFDQIDEFDFYVNFALYSNNIIYLNKFLFYYRQHDSQTRKSSMIENYDRSFKSAFESYLQDERYLNLQRTNKMYCYYRNYLINNSNLNLKRIEINFFLNIYLSFIFNSKKFTRRIINRLGFQ